MGTSKLWLIWLPNTTIDVKTGEDISDKVQIGTDSFGLPIYDQGWCYTSDYIDVPANSSHIHLEYKALSNADSAPATKINNLFFYDKNLKYTGTYINLNNIGEQLPFTNISIPFGVAYVRFSFTSYSPEYELVKDNNSLIYFISECSPVYKNITKKYSKENGNQFFRATISGDIKFIGSDFNKLHASDLDSDIIFIIEKANADRVFTTYYKGHFNKTSCKFNIEKGVAQPKIQTIDQYVRILNKYDNTYDILELGTRTHPIVMSKRPCVQIYIAGGNTVSTFQGNTYWDSEVSEVVDSSSVLDSKYRFVYNHTVNEMKIDDSESVLSGNYGGTDGAYEKYDSNGNVVCKSEFIKIFSAGDIIPNENYNNQLQIYDVVTNKPTRIGIHNGTNLIAEEDIYALQFTNIEDNRKWSSYAVIRGVNPSDIVTPPAGIRLFYTSDEHKELYINSEIKSITVFSPLETTIPSYPKSKILNITNQTISRIFARILCDVDSVKGITTHEFPLNDFTGTNSNRNYKKCIGIRLGDFYATSKATKEPSKYGKNDYGLYFTSKFITDLNLSNFMPVCRNEWVNTSIWYSQNRSWEGLDKEASHKFKLKDGYAISEVIKTLLTKIDPSIMHDAAPEYSHALYDYDFPQFMGPNFNIFITQKTNILKGEYDQAARKAETSLKEIMDMMANCFKCFWFIDEKNRFRIEHISYFINNYSYNQTKKVVDLTIKKDAFNKKSALYLQSEISYDTGDSPARYEFSWGEDTTSIYGSNFAIDVLNEYVQKDKTESISVSSFNPDIDSMLVRPEDFSSDGFALLCPKFDPVRRILKIPIIEVDNLYDENGKTYSAWPQNWYGSWLYLSKFYAYNFSGTRAKSDILGTFSVVDIESNMKNTVQAFFENDPDLYSCFKTSVGEGNIQSISISMNTRLCTIDLAYKPL